MCYCPRKNGIKWASLSVYCLEKKVESRGVQEELVVQSPIEPENNQLTGQLSRPVDQDKEEVLGQ